MSMQRVGTCSRCGGSVYGVRGGWWSVNPPPPDTCRSCGAVAQVDVIQMHPAPPARPSQGLADRVRGMAPHEGGREG